MDGPMRPVVVRPEDGSPSGFGMVHKLMAEWYGGALAILEGTIAPGQLIPPHTHRREDECSYVMTGDLTFLVGDEVVSASAGCYVVKPRDIAHAFWNGSASPARVMEIHTPGGFERHYDEMRQLDEAGLTNGERRAAVSEIQQRYGLEFHWERVPTLIEEYGLVPPRPPSTR